MVVVGHRCGRVLQQGGGQYFGWHVRSGAQARVHDWPCRMADSGVQGLQQMAA